MSVPGGQVAQNLRKRKRVSYAEDDVDEDGKKLRKIERTISVCAWNMQRSPIETDRRYRKQDDARRNRKAQLHYLCSQYDIVCISEPSKGLRESVNDPHAHASLPSGGTWMASSFIDNQSDSAACRSLLFVKARLKPQTVDINFTSGSDDASRYPAAAIINVSGIKLLVVSFHATSYGGASNTNNLIELLHEKTGDMKSWEHVGVMVGGDLNCEEAKYGGTRTPDEVTHQRGGVLDGFYAEGIDAMASALVDGVRIVPGFKLRTTRSAKISGKEPGCFRIGTPLRLSDHAPVCATLTLSGAVPK
ncbi:hypothetical protein [Dyella mobilis]|uniref:Endonuclease/exonuclease/phosphatase domain-containing protein n=1 Tax=Dyella mobilis TaxID=1849582 RepID=A0ABS2KL36_9GAMM|nr:hypothetical protein [Dyella mobilis]MBM7131861.1 hypothetical protein [Dyella mobilis]GLQ96157.1 hypothetical protein GCM10007863_05750 [Dyella mobilis]